MEEILDEEDMSHGDYILNVTSGTPQCQAAMYAINFVKDYNTRLARVNSPRSERQINQIKELLGLKQILLNFFGKTSLR